MESVGVRIAKAPFVYWCFAAMLALYFFLGFNFTLFNNSVGNIALRLVKASSFKNLRLGIDLQGGTRLVLRLEDEKVIFGKLAEVGRSFEKMMALDGVIFSSKEVLNDMLKIEFSTKEDMQKAIDFSKKNYSDFEQKAEENTLIFSLSSVFKEKTVELATDKAINILRTRLDLFDVRGLTVSRQGLNKIVVGLPGMDDISGIKDVVSRAAKLEFKLIKDEAVSKEILLDNYDGILPAGTMIAEDTKGGHAYLVSIFPDVSGSRVSGARVGNDDFGTVMVIFNLDQEGGQDFRLVTRDNVGSRLGIILDDKVVQAPNIKEEIGKERVGSITGFKRPEALKLAQLLRSGSLESSLVIEQENRVGASLGEDSIAKGLMACLLSLICLLFCSIAYYKFAGFLAVLALLFNVLMLLLLLALFKATLTLAGIAGIVLTVGMAIDASILIFERIKEELGQGLVSFSKAVEIGFSGAVAVIIDSNLTTFVAGLVLFVYGGVAVKGFAVTLMLGIISTVITGVFFLRSAFDFCTNVLRFEKISI